MAIRRTGHMEQFADSYTMAPSVLSVKEILVFLLKGPSSNERA